MRGPYNQLINQASYYRNSNWYRQDLGQKGPRPPLPYIMRSGRILRSTTTIPAGSAGASTPYYVAQAIGTYGSFNPSVETSLLQNSVYAGLVSAMKDGRTASMGATLAEWKQSADMVENRTTQLLRLARAVIRRDLNGVKANLSSRNGTVRGNKYISKSGGDPVDLGSIIKPRDKRVADRWLELHFGWSPLIQDIYDACSVLSEPPPPRPIRVKRAKEYNYFVPEGLWTPSDTGNRVKIHVCAGGVSRTSSPNLELFNRLGLINPASVAWEVVPFSFLVDWFVPVGDYLNSWTDFVGYSFDNPYTTIYRWAVGVTKRTREPNPANNYSQTASGVFMQRTLSLPAFKLVIPPLKRLSVTRGATSIALLVQVFANMAKPSSRF
jgi:hypothetical protein